MTAYIGREESGGIVSVEGEKYTATKSLTVQAGQNTLSMELKVDTSSSSSSHTGSWSYEVTFPSSNIDKVTLRLLSQTNSGFNTSPSYEDSRIKGIDYSLSGYQTVTFEGVSCLAGYYIVYVSYEVLTSQKANEENKNYAIVSGWREVMCINPGVHTSGSIRLSEINPVYSITLNTNGGEWDTSSLTSIPITYTKESGEVDSNGINTGNITLPATDAFSSRPGYYFDGWYNNSSFSGSAISSFNVSDKENKTFYAKWTPIEYSVRYYNPNYRTGYAPDKVVSFLIISGGITSTDLPTSYTVEDDFIALPALSKDNCKYSYYDDIFVFDGWYKGYSDRGETRCDYTEKIESIGDGMTEDLMLCAKWVNPNVSISVSIQGTDDNNFTLSQIISGDTVTLSTSESFISYRWMLDGSFISGAENSSYTLDTSALSTGNHYVMLIVTDESGTYSSTANILVTR